MLPPTATTKKTFVIVSVFGVTVNMIGRDSAMYLLFVVTVQCSGLHGRKGVVIFT
jgi:hypothetical protein